jgi:hypothetical protein
MRKTVCAFCSVSVVIVRLWYFLFEKAVYKLFLLMLKESGFYQYNTS